MSVNVKLGNNTINGVDKVKLRKAENDNEYYDFELPLSPNIHFSSTTAPTDTSKLWVKTDTIPNKILINGDVTALPQTVNTFYTTSETLSNRSMIAVDDYIYFVGGSIYSSSTTSYSNKITRYNISTKQSQEMVVMSVRRRNVALANIGQYIYILGGETGSSTYTNIIERFDTINNTITTMTATLPYASRAQVCVVEGSIIYLVGGSSNDVNKYDTENDIAANLYHGSSNWSSMAVTMKDGLIYTFGGYYGSGTSVSIGSSIQTFNVNNSTWSSIGFLPTDLYQSLSCRVGDDFYLIGGATATSTSSYSNKIYKFNLSSHVVTDVTPDGFVVNKRFETTTQIGDISYGYYSKVIYSFSFDLQLTSNNLLICDGGVKSFNVFDKTDLQVKCYPLAVYLGNNNNKAQRINSAIYNPTNTTWENI